MKSLSKWEQEFRESNPRMYEALFGPSDWPFQHGNLLYMRTIAEVETYLDPGKIEQVEPCTFYVVKHKTGTYFCTTAHNQSDCTVVKMFLGSTLTFSGDREIKVVHPIRHVADEWSRALGCRVRNELIHS